MTSGRCRTAEALFQKIVDTLRGTLRLERCGLPFVPAVIARSWLVWALAERGEFIRADTLADEGLRIAEDVGHPFNLAHIYYDIGYFYEVKGDFDAAVEALEKAHSIITQWSLSYLSPFITGFYGHACALAGRVDEGNALLRRAVSEYDAMSLGLFRSLVLMQLAEARFLAGDLDQAKTIAEAAPELATRRGERGHEAWTLRLLAEIALHPRRRDPVTAFRCFRGSLQLATRFGMRPLQAHCHLGISRARPAKMRPGAIEDHRNTALHMYRDMEMEHWVAVAGQ